MINIIDTFVLIVILMISVMLLTITLDERTCCFIGRNNTIIKEGIDHIEHYDLELPNISLTECGTQCTEGVNCAGFGYKPLEKRCFLSKTAILGQPMESLYSDQYTKLDRRCNKINRITDSSRIDGNTLTQNSVYVCSDGENNTITEFQYANLGATSLDGTRATIFDRADSDRLTPVDVKYEVNQIEWPKEKPKESLISALPLDTIKSSSNTKDGSYGFIESDKEFLGQYLLAHQCVVNVPFFDCLKYCEKDPNCAGTEWNKSVIKQVSTDNYDYLYENVCCPKTVIKKVIPRRKEFNRGKFYVKRNLDDILKREKIIVTKADFKDSVPINNRFQLKMTEFKTDTNDQAQQDVSTVRGIIDSLDVKDGIDRQTDFTYAV